MTAAGISGIPYLQEIGAASYELIFIAQLGAFIRGRPHRIALGPSYLLAAALMVPVVTMAFAVSWAWGSPLLDSSEMVRYHGLVNAIGHVGLALAAFAWGRPQPHAPIRRSVSK